jgi:hypothetical protein
LKHGCKSFFSAFRHAKNFIEIQAEASAPHCAGKFADRAAASSGGEF